MVHNTKCMIFITHETNIDESRNIVIVIIRQQMNFSIVPFMQKAIQLAGHCCKLPV
jgi:hypothetical protein